MMGSHAGLKLAVISMGVVLLGGMIFVFATIYHRVTGAGEGSLSVSLSAPCHAAESSLSLPVGSIVLAFETVGASTRYLLGFKDGTQELLTVETCSGKELHRVKIAY